MQMPIFGDSSKQRLILVRRGCLWSGLFKLKRGLLKPAWTGDPCGYLAELLSKRLHYTGKQRNAAPNGDLRQPGIPISFFSIRFCFLQIALLRRLVRLPSSRTK